MRFTNPRDPLWGILVPVITTFVIVSIVSGTYRHCVLLPLVIWVLAHLVSLGRRR